MDDAITLSQLKQEVQAFCEEHDWDQYHDPLHLTVGASTEASELLDIFRFRQPDELEDILDEKRDDVRGELADTLYFLLQFSQIYDIDLSEAFEEKMLENEEQYPVEDFTGSNRKKSDLIS